MDGPASVQRELFSKFMVAYDRVERETTKVDKLIPSEKTLEEREKTKMVPTMSGKKRILRGVVEEQISEVEGILDHLGALADNIDEASNAAKSLAEAEPVPGAVEIDLSEIVS